MSQAWQVVLCNLAGGLLSLILRNVYEGLQAAGLPRGARILPPCLQRTLPVGPLACQ